MAPGPGARPRIAPSPHIAAGCRGFRSGRRKRGAWRPVYAPAAVFPQAVCLQIARDLRLVYPAIVAAVAHAHRDSGELLVAHVIEACHVEREELAAQLRNVAAPVQPDTARLAIVQVDRLAAPAIDEGVILAVHRMHAVQLHIGAPPARLAADRAVAPRRD